MYLTIRLTPYRRVNVQEDETGQLHLRNLTFHCVRRVEEAMEMLQLGDDNRLDNLQFDPAYLYFGEETKDRKIKKWTIRWIKV